VTKLAGQSDEDVKGRGLAIIGRAAEGLLERATDTELRLVWEPLAENTRVDLGGKRPTLLSVSADGLTALLSAPAGAGAGTDVCTITGRVTTKAFTTNDNPVIDPTYPLPVKTGKPKDAF
jgi:hypothetical protein